MTTIAHVGVGAWGKNLLRNFLALKDCRVKYCCDIDKKNIAHAQSLFRDAFIATDDFDRVLADKEVEAVVLATPPSTHAALAIKALMGKKHVFVEKPLALTLDDAYAMKEAVKKSNKMLMVGHLLLYHPAIQKIKEYITQGVLGDIYYIYSTRVNLGQVRDFENALWSLTAHDISVALHFLGTTPVGVTAHGQGYLQKNIEDVVFLNFEFPKKVLLNIHASWLDPHKIRKFTVVGSKKMVVFDDMESVEKIKLYDKGVDVRQLNEGDYDTFLTLREGDIIIPKINMVEPLRLECTHFITMVAQNKKPLSDIDNGIEVLTMLAAAQQSLASGGKPVKI